MKFSPNLPPICHGALLNLRLAFAFSLSHFQLGSPQFPAPISLLLSSHLRTRLLFKLPVFALLPSLRLPGCSLDFLTFSALLSSSLSAFPYTFSGLF